MKINNSTIILSGGGSEKQTLSLDNFFFNSLKKNANILYIPTALIGHKMYEGAENWFKSVIALHNREDLILDILKDFKIYKGLNKYDAIYIGGGNTWMLRKLLRENNFDEKLISFINKDNGIIYGGSAGAIVLGENISCQNDEKIEGMEYKGFDMIVGYSVACHYDESKDSEIKKWCLDNNSNIIAIPEDSGVILNNNNISTIGNSKCFYFTGQSKKKINNQEVSPY